MRWGLGRRGFGQRGFGRSARRRLEGFTVVAGLVLGTSVGPLGIAPSLAQSSEQAIVAQAEDPGFGAGESGAGFAPGTGGATAPSFPGGPTPQQAALLDLTPNPAPEFVAVHIDSISPQVADGAAGSNAVGGVPIVTVQFTVENRAAVPVRDITARLQRGTPESEPASIRTGLTAPEAEFAVAGPFEDVAAELAPGASVQHSVSLPLSAVDGQASLGVIEPGVYPLLVNVNGTPDNQGQLLLDTARTLLPVLPGALRSVRETELAPSAEDPNPALPGAESALVDPAWATPVTMIYPIAAAPTRRATVPGLDGPEPTVHLTDRSLLDELEPEGRLNGLLDALEQVESRSDALNEAICLGIDPETLRTINDIAAGLDVVVDGEQEADRITDAAPAASAWLSRMRAIAGEHCTLALPPAQADLAAVAAVDSTALDSAVGAGPGLEVQRILGVEPLNNVVVPATGTLSEQELGRLTRLQEQRAIIAASAVRTGEDAIPRSGVISLDGGPRALTYDPYLGAALAATSSRPEQPRYSADSQRYWVQADSAEARMQDARASLMAPVLANLAAANSTANGVGTAADAPDLQSAPPAAGTDSDVPIPTDGAPAPNPRQLLVVPPQVWSVDDVSAASFLDILATQLNVGTMRAVALSDALDSAPVDPAPARLATPELGVPITPDTLGQQFAESELENEAPSDSLVPGDAPDIDPGAVDVATIGRVREAMRQLGILRTVIDTDDPSAVNADAFLDPLRSEALRALTTTGRRAGGAGTIDSIEAVFGEPTAASGPTTGRAARDASAASLSRLEDALFQAFAEIELLPPGTVYRMASPNSPLLLVARNGLPFPIRVGVKVDTPEGIRVDSDGQIAVPTAGSRTVQLPAETSDTQGRRAQITMQLVTSQGTPLSDRVEISVQSGGSRVALIFTIAALLAAAALVLRRYFVVRRGRVRGSGRDHGATLDSTSNHTSDRAMNASSDPTSDTSQEGRS